MKLLIDTADPVWVKLSLMDRQKNFEHAFETDHNLSERLAQEIQKFLHRQKIKPAEIDAISINPHAEGFSRLRTAVATANALAFALNLSQKSIQPRYSRPPNITRPNRA